MPELTIQAEDGGEFKAYAVFPETEKAPAVVVIQEIFGVNEIMRNTCKRLAAEGYIAICPDLFWRLEPGIELTDQTEEEWDKAFELMNAFDIDKGVEDISATLQTIRKDERCSGKVGAMGFCLGGKLAYLTATRTGSDATVGYYGVEIDKFINEKDGIKKPLMLHIAEEDQFVDKDAQAKIKGGLENNPLVTLHSYPGMDHAFTRVGGDHYDETAAKTAHARTHDFLLKFLK
ncbi:MAG: carboxymethylenebutenolidase [Alphaproteobacteria bacterium]|nr:carboxymethylenebutenolidase [Alphaproteobacteria bacterium]|tara:strand:- start:27 stop:722 length:696 start_codon:yes stop_codon:yes gene_type:complete